MRLIVFDCSYRTTESANNELMITHNVWVMFDL